MMRDVEVAPCCSSVCVQDIGQCQFAFVALRMFEEFSNNKLEPYWSRGHCALRHRHTNKHIILGSFPSMAKNISFCNQVEPWLESSLYSWHGLHGQVYGIWSCLEPSNSDFHGPLRAVSSCAGRTWTMCAWWRPRFVNSC